MSLPLVLVPGMMCDERLFGPQIEKLGAGREIKVVLPTADTTAGMADQVLAAAPERFALAGLSLGGIVAMEVMARDPGRVAALALMDTNPLAEREEVRARRGPQIEAVRQGRLREVMRDEMKPNYLAPAPGRKDVLDLCMDMAEALGPEVFVSQSVALRDRPDRQDTLRHVKVPSLILCGAHDRLCPPERHWLMADLIPQARLTIIDDAGHLPTLEAPGPTTEALSRWLEGAIDPRAPAV